MRTCRHPITVLCIALCSVIAALAGGFNDYPGDKYPGLFVFFAVPTPGHTPQELGDGILTELDRLKKEDVSEDELKMVKTRVKTELLRSLGDNSGLARQFALGQALFGDWRAFFQEVDRINKVTSADIRRVANQTFVDSNRNIGIIESTQMAGGRAAKQ